MVLAQHILVVEDNADLRGLFVDVVSAQHNLLAEGAESLAEAEALLRSHHYDAILLDLGLPDGDGRDLCLKLRQSGLHIPIILLTGAVGRQDGAQGRACGASDYLVKPIRMTELVDRLQRHLQDFVKPATAAFVAPPPHVDNLRP